MPVKTIKDKSEVIATVDVLEINGENRYNRRSLFPCVERLIKSKSLVGPPNGGSPFDVIAKLSLSPRLLYLTLTRLFGGRRMDSL